MISDSELWVMDVKADKHLIEVALQSDLIRSLLLDIYGQDPCRQTSPELTEIDGFHAPTWYTPRQCSVELCLPSSSITSIVEDIHPNHNLHELQETH